MNEEILDLGFLDVNIYSCISSQIDTDRVVITDKQLDHIADHHPEAYDETLIELKSILASPDYIFKDDNHIDTGLVVKAIRSADSYFYIVVKVCTNSNGGKFANSVISGWTISERRLKNYLRHNSIER